MKRLARAGGVVLALVLVASSAACGSDSDGGGSASGGGGGEDYEIAFIPGLRGDPFYVSMECGAKAEAEKLGVQLTTQAAEKWDPALQTPIINGVAAKRPDAMLVVPTDTKAVVGPLQQAKGDGAKILTLDTTIVPGTGIPEAEIATDNVAAGVEAAKAMAEQIGDSGAVLPMTGSAGISSTDFRIQGFREEIKRHPNITLLETQFSQDEPTRAASIVSATLARNPQLKGVFAAELQSADGAATGVRNAQAQGKVKIVGFDASPPQVDQLREGLVQALIVQQPYEMGRLGVEQAAAVLDGKRVQLKQPTGTVIATKDNIDDPSVSKYFYKEECS